MCVYVYKIQKKEEQNNTDFKRFVSKMYRRTECHHHWYHLNVILNTENESLIKSIESHWKFALQMHGYIVLKEAGGEIFH